MRKDARFDPSVEDLILKALKERQDRFVSGEELSRWYGISRTAIWKEIQKLRQAGYVILARPHEGYRLLSVPDRMLPNELTWGLSTQRMGCRVYAYEMTDSTMDIAHRLAVQGAPEGTLVVAEGQRCGRGRMGRRWFSPKGKGIYISLVLRPAIPLTHVSQITLVAAVAVAKAIQQTTRLKPQVKWPNDLLLSEKKVGGILTELKAELDRVEYVVLGIGLNVNTESHQLPSHATSLKEVLGHPVDRLALARTLLGQLDFYYAQFLRLGLTPLIPIWRGFAEFLGRRVRVVTGDDTIDGQALDLDPTGSLKVRTDTGKVETISAGEVLILR